MLILNTWTKVQGYSTLDKYKDQNTMITIIDKKISTVVDMSFNGEKNSEYISFVMDRYYDGIDLKDKLINVCYTINKEEPIGGADAVVNVYASDEQIKFGWVIPPACTAEVGTVTFGILVIGTEYDKDYVLKSEVATYEVKETFISGDGIVESDDNWFEQFLIRIDEELDQKIIDGKFELEQKVEELIETIPEDYTQLTEDVETLKTTTVKSVNYITPDENGNINIETEEAVGKVYEDSIHGEIFNDYDENIASGDYSHAEGSETYAEGTYSHAEGYGSHAFGGGSHAEGVDTYAQGDGSHAEGSSTSAIGDYSHAEGVDSRAEGEGSHAEGDSEAIGNYSHAEGGSIAYGENSHAEGNSVAEGESSHSEGINTYAYGENSHSGGESTTAYGTNSTAIGFGTASLGNSSFASGNGVLWKPTLGEAMENDENETPLFPITTYRNRRCIEIDKIVLKSVPNGGINYAYILKKGTRITFNLFDPHNRDFSFDWVYRGNTTVILPNKTITLNNIGRVYLNDDSYSESQQYYGYLKLWNARGIYSQSYDDGGFAVGNSSAIFGDYNIAEGNSQTVVGKYNEVDADALFIVGNGSDKYNRKNAMIVDREGVKVGANKELLATKNYVDAKSTIITDKSLSVADKCADAKAVGDRFRLLEHSGIAQFNFKYESGDININGEYVADNRVIRTVNPIGFIGEVSFKSTSPQGVIKLHDWDESGAYQGYNSGVPSNDFTYVCEEGHKYVITYNYSPRTDISSRVDEVAKEITICYVDSIQTIDYVPTSNGDGTWSWKEQKGGGGSQEEIEQMKQDIQTNATNIAQNTQNINTNTQNISDMELAISENTDDIEANTTQLGLISTKPSEGIGIIDENVVTEFSPVWFTYSSGSGSKYYVDIIIQNIFTTKKIQIRNIQTLNKINFSIDIRLSSDLTSTLRNVFNNVGTFLMTAMLYYTKGGSLNYTPLIMNNVALLDNRTIRISALNINASDYIGCSDFYLVLQPSSPTIDYLRLDTRELSFNINGLISQPAEIIAPINLSDKTKVEIDGIISGGDIVATNTDGTTISLIELSNRTVDVDIDEAELEEMIEGVFD